MFEYLQRSRDPRKRRSFLFLFTECYPVVQGWAIWIMTIRDRVVIKSGTMVSDPAGSVSCQDRSDKSHAAPVMLKKPICMSIFGDTGLYWAISNDIRIILSNIQR